MKQLITIAENDDGTWTLKITEHLPGKKNPRLRYACYNLPSAQAAVSQLITWQSGLIVI